MTIHADRQKFRLIGQGCNYLLHVSEDNNAYWILSYHDWNSCQWTTVIILSLICDAMTFAMSSRGSWQNLACCLFREFCSPTCGLELCLHSHEFLQVDNALWMQDLLSCHCYAILDGLLLCWSMRVVKLEKRLHLVIAHLTAKAMLVNKSSANASLPICRDIYAVWIALASSFRPGWRTGSFRICCLMSGCISCQVKRTQASPMMTSRMRQTPASSAEKF